jgi:iron complex transport system substrate-binding protein
MKLTKLLLLTAVVLLLARAATAWCGDAPGRVEIVDSLGRRVAVPPKVERIISLEPETTRIIVALGAGARLVGIDFFLRHYDHIFPLVFPASGQLTVVSNQGQELHYEQALRLRPDIVFASPSEFGAAREIEAKMAVPVAALASMGRFDGLFGEITTLGRILGREDRAAMLVSYLRTRLEEAARLSSAVPPEGRPSVYLAFWGSLVRTPVAYEPVEAAGGRNIASGLLPEYLGAPSATISLEKILAWDPDVILVQGNYLPAERQVTIPGILKDRRLASLKAVRTGRVSYTFGYWYWWDPALVLVETLYLARLFGSGKTPTDDFVRMGDEIFLEVYGTRGVFSALCRILECHEWPTR